MAPSIVKPNTPSGSSTPTSRFTSENKDAEDRLKTQTVGLLQLSDFRKRRAEAFEGRGSSSGSATPSTTTTDAAPKRVKTKRKPTSKTTLSFGGDDDDDDDDKQFIEKRSFAPNNAAGYVAKSMTKSALARESLLKDRLRREFLATQAAVKATDFLLPFVFYDGTATSGATCRVKKGNQIWLFLDRARKAGAAATAAKKDADSFRSWARISVDDLLLVRGDLILPHHYEFYYFMLNETLGRDGRVFPFVAERTAASPVLAADDGDEEQAGGLSVPGQESKVAADTKAVVPDEQLEGYGQDPSLTKVVDRRWYEKNKHIYPASTWETFDPNTDYTTSIRKDTMGNVFFAGGRK